MKLILVERRSRAGAETAALPAPGSPSYPSEQAAEARTFQTVAEQAGWSRALADLQYPSDYDAGLALKRRIAEQVIAKALAGGSQ